MNEIDSCIHIPMYILIFCFGIYLLHISYLMLHDKKSHLFLSTRIALLLLRLFKREDLVKDKENRLKKIGTIKTYGIYALIGGIIFVFFALQEIFSIINTLVK